jgi:hypothetical protein
MNIIRAVWRAISMVFVFGTLVYSQIMVVGIWKSLTALGIAITMKVTKKFLWPGDIR